MNTDLLELYSDYLLSAFSYTTATGLSKMTDGAVSHDKVTRFLSQKELDSPALWRSVKPLVRELEEDEDSGALIIDDTIEEKPYTDESELVCWHYDETSPLLALPMGGVRLAENSASNVARRPLCWRRVSAGGPATLGVSGVRIPPA